MGGPIPSFASGLIDCTACAVTCAAEWRRMLRPSGESRVTGSTVSVVVVVAARSFSSPLTRMATTFRSVNNSQPVDMPQLYRGCGHHPCVRLNDREPAPVFGNRLANLVRPAKRDDL